MNYTNWYWVGSKVPYGEYLRRRNVALQGAAPVVSVLYERSARPPSHHQRCGGRHVAWLGGLDDAS
jgi:hypothetical protein